MTLIDSILLIALIASLLMLGFCQVFYLTELKRKNTELDKKDATIQSLLNRLQSEDLHTFLSLETNRESSTPVAGFPNRVGMSDEEELVRLGQAQGIGIELNDDREFTDTLTELGANWDQYDPNG